jgi:hypothetical protein
MEDALLLRRILRILKLSLRLGELIAVARHPHV